MGEEAQEPRVLFVDDEPIIVRLVQRAFVRAPWITSLATSVAEARDLLDRHPFAVVVTDYRMPGGTGLELLERVREVQPQAVRVLVSGEPLGGRRKPGPSEVAQHCVAKPWTIDDLRTRVAAWVGDSRIATS